MRNRILLGLCVALMLSTVAKAQDKTATLDGAPQYIGVIAAYDTTKGEYRQLERIRPTVETSSRLLGYLGGQTRGVYSGERSPVRFKYGLPLHFVIRVERQDKDPANLIQFWRLKIDDGTRILPLADQAHAYTSVVKDLRAENSIPFTAKVLGKEFFEFWALEPLPAGEYSVSAADIPDGFNFGIDP